MITHSKRNALERRRAVMATSRRFRSTGKISHVIVAASMLLFAAGGCSAQDANDAKQEAPPFQAAFDPDPGMGEDAGALTPAGPLQGNWRVTRPDDPSDAAIMLVHAIQDGALIEGSYVLYQPFCGIDLPPVRAGAETCEFDGVSADIRGEVVNARVILAFAPGADGQDHRLVFEAAPATGPLTGSYFAPGETEGLPVILTRAPD